MSRLRIIRDGAYSWLDEGPANGLSWSGRVSGSLLVPPPSKSRRMAPVQLICSHCGAAILGRNPRAVFCSSLCQNRAKAARQHARQKAAKAAA